MKSNENKKSNTPNFLLRPLPHPRICTELLAVEEDLEIGGLGNKKESFV